MNTILLAWNPAFSSFRMADHLYIIEKLNHSESLPFNPDWSIRDHEKVSVGDRYYMVKHGLGATGIVACGTITSLPEKGEDWSGKGRDVYYSNYAPDVMLNPDAVPILTSAELEQAIPSVDWVKGHSGVVLTEDEAARLNELWASFMTKNHDLLWKKGEEVKCNDRVFLREQKPVAVYKFVEDYEEDDDFEEDDDDDDDMRLLGTAAVPVGKTDKPVNPDAYKDREVNLSFLEELPEEMLDGHWEMYTRVIEWAQETLRKEYLGKKCVITEFEDSENMKSLLAILEEIDVTVDEYTGEFTVRVVTQEGNIYEYALGMMEICVATKEMEKL